MNAKQTNHEIDPGLTAFVEKALEIRFDSNLPLTWEKLPDSGSNRLFYRLHAGDETLIVINSPEPFQGLGGLNENDSYLFLSRHMRAGGMSVPEIYDYKLPEGYFLVEDLGETSLMRIVLESDKDPKTIVPLYQKILFDLLDIQIRGVGKFDVREIHSPSYTALTAFQRAWGYFRDSFLMGYLGWEHPGQDLDREVYRLIDPIDSVETLALVYYDFQSSNILIKDGVPGYVDFQAARMGPPQYDVASLLNDPYVDLPADLRDSLLDHYLSLIEVRDYMNPNLFMEHYPLLALMRTFQALGAYGHLVRIKGKTEYEKYIPVAVRDLGEICEGEEFSEYSSLGAVVKRVEGSIKSAKSLGSTLLERTSPDE
ncbi:aminoglycoside phosphotransferase family protein [candidate division KSB1 bacterium]